MRQGWFSKLRSHSSKVVDLPGFIDGMPCDTQKELDDLMLALFGEIPSLQVLPVDGYSKYGFHVKYGPAQVSREYDVCMMVIPMKRMGVRVRTRCSLGENWSRVNVDGQRLWQKKISGANDIQSIVQHCRKSCGY